MKQEDNNISIKQNRWDFKFQAARLQSIILDSMKRPSIALTMFLEIVLMLQLFRAPFGYLNTLLINPTWAYVPLFNYLVPAYYQIYMNSTQFLTILIIILVLMLSYIMSVGFLLFTSRKSQFSKILAKIVRVLLQIFSTVLFSSMVKTVLTIFHCQSPNVSTNEFNSEFKCLYDQSIWLTYLSVIILGVFTILIMFQSYLKFEFYALDTKASIIRKSQQWVPILLTFHVVIEIVAITQSQLILLLVMNIIPIIMMIHLCFMEQALTQVYYKTMLSLSLSLMYLILFIDVNYFLNIPLSFVLWFITLIILLPTFLMLPTLNIKYQLQNINKWNSAADRLQYASGVRMLLSKNKSIKILSYLQGYADIHFQKCQQLQCPFRHTRQKLDRIKVFRQNKELLDCQIKLQELAIKIFSEGIKYFPNTPTLNIEFSTFLYERKMKQRALKYILSSYVDNFTLQQYYKFYRLRKVLHEELIEKGKSTLDLLTQMKMRDLQQKFLRAIQKASLSDVQLWSILLQQHPDFGKLDQVGSQRIKIGQQVRDLYTQISQKGNSQKITALYVEYLINVCKESGNYVDVQEIIKKKYFLQQKIVVFDWANSSHPSLIISGQQNTFGQIQDLNLSASILLGYQKNQLISHKLQMIMPHSLSCLSNQLISLKDTSKQFYLRRKDNYLVKVNKTIYLSSSIMKGSIFICTLQPLPVNSMSCKVIVESFSPFNIIGMQAKNISFFGIEVRQTDQPMSIMQMSQHIYHSLQNGTPLQKQYKLSQLMISRVILKMKATDQQLKQVFTVKMTKICEKCIQIDFIKKKQTLSIKPAKVKINDFKFQPVMVDGNLIYSNNLTTKYQYITNKVQIDSQKYQTQHQNKINYGKGIRTVRLQYDQIQIIQQSSVSQSSQPKSSVHIINPLGITIASTKQNDNKNILANRQTIKKFIQGNSVGKTNNILLILTTVISISWIIIICFVFRSNHNSLVSSLISYVDQNIKIGQIQIINVLITQVALIQQGKSNANKTDLVYQLQQSLSYLQKQKQLGHVYSVNTVMLDGSPQVLTNLQFIDSLNSNIQDLIIALSSGFKVSPNIISFSLNNQQLVHTQTMQYLINWDHTIRKDFDRSLIIQSVIFALFLLMQGCIITFTMHKIYKMYHDKIGVLKIFLQITEQNVRIMSIKTQQFLNTLYNNEADIDDQETIIRKTNNKHTFAIKKKFKLIKKNSLIYIIFGVIFTCVLAIPISSFSVSVNGLRFKRGTLPFINSTSSGTSFFYHHLHDLQKNVYNSASNPTPGYQFISFYRSMIANFYQTFITSQQFADYWTSVMMQDVCNGRTKLQYACLSSSSKHGGMALITDLVLNSISLRNFSTDFSTSYYNLYKIMSSLHKSLAEHVLRAFERTVRNMKRNLLMLMIISIILTITLLVVVGIRAMQKYTQQIDQTRKMLTLLPIEYLRSCESINQYLQDALMRKNWILF